MLHFCSDCPPATVIAPSLTAGVRDLPSPRQGLLHDALAVPGDQTARSATRVDLPEQQRAAFKCKRAVREPTDSPTEKRRQPAPHDAPRTRVGQQLRENLYQYPIHRPRLLAQNLSDAQKDGACVRSTSHQLKEIVQLLICHTVPTANQIAVHNDLAVDDVRQPQPPRHGQRRILVYEHLVGMVEIPNDLKKPEPHNG